MVCSANTRVRGMGINTTKHNFTVSSKNKKVTSTCHCTYELRIEVSEVH
jgi:hypothetical protein